MSFDIFSSVNYIFVPLKKKKRKEKEKYVFSWFPFLGVQHASQLEEKVDVQHSLLLVQRLVLE